MTDIATERCGYANTNEEAGEVRELILFDIDGTLLKTGDLLHQQALLEAVDEVFGIRASLEGVPLGGMLDSQIVRLALAKYDVPPEDIRVGLPDVMGFMGDRYRALLNGEDRRHWLLPGVEELIERAADRYVLSVLTGNASGVALAKLSAAGLARYFPFGAYGDSADHRHELVPVALDRMRSEIGVAPDQALVVLIGDTPRDIEAARESGARVIAVATGRYSVAQLDDHKPDELFESLEDVDAVLTVLEQLTGRRGR
jgi:phosphoglycolate phosphatase